MAEGGGPLLLIRGDVVVSPALLADLVADPRGPAVAVVLDESGETVGIRVDLATAHMLTATAGLLGADPIGATVAALAATGAPTAVVPRRGYVLRVPLDDADAAQALRDLDNLDEEAVRLAAAVKAKDSPFTTYLVSPWSRYVARWVAGLGLTPNIVTTLSLLVGFAAAGAFAFGNRAGLVAGAVLLQVSFALDCVDGQLARYARRYSRLGGWLDATFDRVKEYAVYAGLAAGSIRFGDDVWTLATAALGLQVYRHSVDFAFSRHQSESTDGAVSGVGSGSALGRRAVALSTQTSASGLLDFAKRVIVLPIGERWALLSIAAAVADARAAFLALLIAGGVAATYTTTGRVLRTLASG